jgi:hypothetical protein
MDRLFSPCTRLHEMLESRGLLERVRRYHPEPLQELNLDVSTEELLSAERLYIHGFVRHVGKHKYGCVVDTACIARSR